MIQENIDHPMKRFLPTHPAQTMLGTKPNPGLRPARLVQPLRSSFRTHPGFPIHPGLPIFPTLLALPALLITLALSGCGGPNPDVSLTVSRLFSNGAIVQRNVEVPVWGTAPPGASVSIALDGASQEVKAESDGTWRGALEPHEAGGPHTLTISSGDQTLDVRDVWFGDVWIASGQSNMEWTVANAADAEHEIRSANDPLIRHFKVPRSWANAPEPTLAGGAWHTADSAHVGAFTAVGYYFARALRTTVDVPVGILNTSWGGSRIEPWMHPEALAMDPDTVAAVIAEREQRIEDLRQTFLEEHRASETEDPGLKDGVAVWADPDLDLSDWGDIEAPSRWEEAGYPRLDGIAWYRTTVELSPNQVEEGQATLHLGPIDDEDMTWVNDTLVGQTQDWAIPRAYDVPAEVLRPGRNTITIRVRDMWGYGGMVGDAEAVRLETPMASIPLAGTWKFRVGRFVLNANDQVNQVPTLLYNKMIHPLLSFPVTGFLWYQGESNAGNEEDASAYAERFQSLITSWRAAWGNPTAPFLFVSLANFLAAVPEPGESDWAILRESQSAALALPRVGQAITIDIGDADDIHPRNKQDVGRRLALAARYWTYGEEDLVYSGPTYRDHRVEGDRVILSFDHVGSGLVARGSELGGFAIAGTDDPFAWANARIVGNTVVVSSPLIQNPTAVRYAWADNPDRANLYNEEGLPAAPFRTGR